MVVVCLAVGQVVLTILYVSPIEKVHPYDNISCGIPTITFTQCNLRAQKSHTIKFHGNFLLSIIITFIVYSI